MIPLILTNDLVLVSLVESLLDAADIDYFLADRYTSAIEGSIGAIPRRILVAPDDLARAQRCLTEAGLGGELERAT